MFKDYLYPVIAPGVSMAISLYEAYTGKDLVTQQRLPTWQRILSVALAFVPLVVRAAKGPITQAARGVVQIGKAALAAISHGAKQIAALAVQLRLPARTMLRFAGKLARLPLDKLRRLFQRVEEAQKARRALQLTNDEAVLARQVDEAFREFTPTAKAVPQVIKAATARAFMFLTREQPVFLGRLLGRRLSLTTPGNVKSGLQAAERSAAGDAQASVQGTQAALGFGTIGMQQSVESGGRRKRRSRFSSSCGRLGQQILIHGSGKNCSMLGARGRCAGSTMTGR
jgi:hypothetical protein